MLSGGFRSTQRETPCCPEIYFAVIAERYADQISECQMSLTRARANLGAHTAEVKEYEAEVIKIIRGESKLSSDLLSKIHEEAKARMEEAEKIVRDLESKLENSEKMRDRLAEQYDDISGWAELYDTCDLASKKMIISRLMKEVRVKRDYEIEIDLTASCEALGISLDKPIVFKESA